MFGSWLLPRGLSPEICTQCAAVPQSHRQTGHTVCCCSLVASSDRTHSVLLFLSRIVRQDTRLPRDLHTVCCCSSVASSDKTHSVLLFLSRIVRQDTQCAAVPQSHRQTGHTAPPLSRIVRQDTRLRIKGRKNQRVHQQRAIV
jgi:hypothetical protein